ncbi:hypothetical protein RMQ97_09265 [Maricaulis sp. D1M11]
MDVFVFLTLVAGVVLVAVLYFRGRNNSQSKNTNLAPRDLHSIVEELFEEVVLVRSVPNAASRQLGVTASHCDEYQLINLKTSSFKNKNLRMRVFHNNSKAVNAFSFDYNFKASDPEPFIRAFRARLKGFDDGQIIVSHENISSNNPLDNYLVTVRYSRSTYKNEDVVVDAVLISSIYGSMELCVKMGV